MKKTILLAAALALALTAQADTTQLFGSITQVTVNNTSSNSPSAVVAVVQNPAGFIKVSHGALTTYTNLTMTGQLALDGTNFVTATATWTATTTNAATEAWYPQWTLPSLYFRSVATTTANVTVGTAFVQ